MAEKISELKGISASLEDGESVVGGGATPGQSLPTRLVVVSHARLSAQELEARLRRNSPPILARIERGQLLIDLRTVFADQEDEIVQAFRRIASEEL
jgi:L-seryl-tRNA(Ser) seleniumtransferase